MQFIAWHYSAGIKLYLSRWKGAFGWVVHFFSLTQLLRSLFAPYKRLVDTEKTPGFNLSRWLTQLSFNIISRCIGAAVRLWLFGLGMILLLPIMLIGAIGFLFWLVFPPLGYIYFLSHDPQGQRKLKKLVDQINASPHSSIQIILQSPAGQFMLTHLGVDAAALTPSIFIDMILPPMSPITFTQIVHKSIDVGYWDQKHLLSAGLAPDDLLLAAHWWDRTQHLTEEQESVPKYGRPGIGLELLFGYTPTLDKYGVDLSLTPNFASHLIARGEIVSRLERTLSSGRSAVIAGQPGVGKKTIVLEFAYRSKTGQLGENLANKRVIEFDYNILLSKSLDINQKKSLLGDILLEAASAGNIILVIKDIHRLVTPELEGLDFTDIFEHYFETGKLLLIAIQSSTDYDRFIAPNPRMRKYLETIEATPPTAEQATEILLEFATNFERQEKRIITVPAIRSVISGSDKYVTDTPFPEKALELLDHAIALSRKNNSPLVTKDNVNQVLVERTGVSLARLTESEKTKLAQLEQLIQKRVIGQDRAAALIGKTLRARSAGTKSENRPLGSLLFLGPTGVGKTETAKALAEVYYGSDSQMIRFDMAEYAGPEGLIRLIGSVSRNQPGSLSMAIKKSPASLLLLDEIEKAPPEVFNLFLSVLDEGMLTDAFGQKIICKHLFIIATSNAGAAFIREQVQQGTPDLTKPVLDYVQKQGLFSPEFLNRFDGVVVFEPLNKEQLRQIAINLIAQTAKNLSVQGINLRMADSAVDRLIQLGYEPEFGARPMRRVVELEVGDTLGKGILSGDIQPGDTVELIAADPGPFAYRKPTFAS